jgi:hypothetical protein
MKKTEKRTGEYKQNQTMMVMMNKKTHRFLHISLYDFIIAIDETLIGKRRRPIELNKRKVTKGIGMRIKL